jgi:hypothetical protein
VVALAALVPVAAPAGAATEATPDPTAAPAYDDVIDLTFPVNPARVSIADWYDAGRVGHVHQATDIMGTKLLPIYAAMGGEVTRMPLVDDQYGYRLVVAGDDGRSYSYVHLNNDTPGTDDGRGTAAQAYAPGVALGSRVERGQHIAFMGDSGNAEDTGPHLHFSITDPAITDPYGTHIRNPYKSLLDAIKRGDIPTATAFAVGPSAPPPPPPPPAPSLSTLCGSTVSAQSFSDLSITNVHSQAVECLAGLQVTFGVGVGLYAPSDSVTRLQMASFTARLLEAGGVSLPQSPTDAFDDDDGTVHEQAVNQLVALKVIRGDTGEVGRDFQGRVAMKRDRMAAWMTRAYALIAGHELPASTTDHFTDDSALHQADINRLADAGIVQGTSPGIYSPRNSVRRDQMASYLARTLAYAEST